MRRSMGWPLWAPAAKDWGWAWRRIRFRRAPHEDLPVRAMQGVRWAGPVAAKVRAPGPVAGAESAAVPVVEVEEEVGGAAEVSRF